jgi:6-phosphogluconate dehydrogenase
MKQADIGMIGLGVMGQNLARNMASKGYSVAGYDTAPDKVAALLTYKDEGAGMIGTSTLQEFAQSLKLPRRIMMMVPAGPAVDQLIQSLTPALESNDILIDGGNSNFEDTTRRTRELEAKGFAFVGTGVSGGEEGALHGPSIMPGGSPAAWPHLKPILQAIAAKVSDGTPCCDWVGNEGAGHYVKMVHNGIEYGDMQLISEAYFLLDVALGLPAAELKDVFAAWNEGELNSYLIEITRDIFGVVDPETGRPLVEVIKDTAGQKGTGKWTSQSALDLGVPAPTVAEAVFARCLSAVKTEREAASRVLTGPDQTYRGDKQAFVEAVRQALYASKICSYAQGFQLMREASKEYGWDLQFGRISQLWRAGCIIRAQFLDRIKEAFDERIDLPNLLLAPYFKSAIDQAQPAWRQVVSTAFELGVPVPAFASALAYYDGYRRSRLPANLLQAQRDYFGAHTYQRVDKPGVFHTEWT